MKYTEDVYRSIRHEDILDSELDWNLVLEDREIKGFSRLKLLVKLKMKKLADFADAISSTSCVRLSSASLFASTGYGHPSVLAHLAAGVKELILLCLYCSR